MSYNYIEAPDTDANYERGWEHAKPYWEAKYQQRVIDSLLADGVLSIAISAGLLEYIVNIIDAVEPEDVKGDNK